jgi:hypothetical protein
MVPLNTTMLSASTLLSFGSLVTSSSFYIICGLLPQGLTRRDGENGSITASECGSVNIGLCSILESGRECRGRRTLQLTEFEMARGMLVMNPREI